METATDLPEQDRSFDSKDSKDEDPHYADESDGEPPSDQPGDLLTIIKKRQVTKRIITPGQNLGKPGRPFTVFVTIKGYFAGPDTTGEDDAKKPEEPAQSK